ncbi:MAG: DUF4399 domain-containing protein [Longimicrobiales bacterium]
MARLPIALTLALAMVGCGGGDAESQPDPVDEPPPPAASVSIVSPAAGATVPAGPLTVVFEVEGLVVAPAGTMDTGTGHHHLIVDADVESWTEPIGVEEGRYIHMGQAQTEFVLEGLEPGEHRLIAVVADGVHIPLSPPVSDTITITVEGG